MKNCFLFFMAWFFGLLLVQVGEFYQPDFEFAVVEASSGLVPEVNVAHWQLNLPCMQGITVCYLPKAANPTHELSKLWKEPVAVQFFTCQFAAFLIKFRENTFTLKCLPSLPLYLFNRILRL
ncbi:hypothetical protein [Adhaeribacter radiodurans]|uniref:Uncharacterized protein n=1 Tax=Adhaeribacter radiodurans TaxID=2745197 RepID=A0A7L7L8P9_9BACT|nr:hypothetical protein [Adhaeribacter radiodurans]QMU29197.1 hypothetical protein HUW48_14635 [Adhaeribacter radiodurans]